MLINIGKLADGTYTHNDHSERAIRDLLESIGLTTYDTNTPGVKDARQDFGLGRYRVELKITSWMGDFRAETHYDAARTKPSGFSLCTAELTMIVQPGNSNKYGPVWKVRLYRTCDIKAAMDPTFMDGDLRRKNPSVASWGASCIDIKAINIPHVWIGDIQRDSSTSTINTDRFIPNPLAREQFSDFFSDDMMVIPPHEYFNLHGTY
jgi:hypothetical protein